MKTIGEAAKDIGVSTHTLRYYEKSGLLPAAQRNQSGRRLYDEDLINQIKFIKRAQRMHFSLDDIKKLLILDQQTSTPKPEVRDLVKSKLEIINDNINELHQLQASLQQLLSSCEKSQKKDTCPILNEMKEQT